MFAFEFEPVSVEDVKRLIKAETAPIFHKASDPFKALRRKESPVVLAGYSIAWMSKLPRQVQPRHCADKYPRIINKLAALWDMEAKASGYLRELLVDTRGTRKGFPTDVAQELYALRMYRNAKFNSHPQDAWALEKLARA